MLTYKDIPGWFSEKDVESYRNLIGSLPNNSTILELGCWMGRSLASVSDIILQKNITVCVVDTFEGTTNEGDAHKVAREIDLKSEFINNISEFGLGHPNVHVYKMTTDEAAEQFKKLKVNFDFIFIDADHSTEAVTKDINNYYRLLKNSNSILAGHDLSWETVRKAIENCVEDTNTVTHNGENLWWFEPEKVKYKYPSVSRVLASGKHKEMSLKDMGVTAVVCTKDRYEHLYNTLLCILNQRLSPDYLIIYDDSDNKIIFGNDYKWLTLFTLFESKNIECLIINTRGHGQNRNHQDSIKEAKTKYIWRVDDDLVFGNNVLNTLYNTISGDSEIGAVAPRVFMQYNTLTFNSVSGKITDVFFKMNTQLCVDGSGCHEVEHLHCTFLYDRTLGVSYHDKLSQVGHREETIFSHRMFRLGYKLIVNLDTEVYHLKAQSGGIRSKEVTEQMFINDENLFLKELESYKVESSNRDYEVKEEIFFAHLNNGIGDHFAFKQLLPELQKKYDKLIIAVSYPEVFWDVSGISLISIEEGKKIIEERGKTEDRYSIYTVMSEKKEEFKKIDENYILQAYKTLYL